MGGHVNFKQCLLAIDTQLGVRFVASRRVSQSGAGGEPTADPQPRGSRRAELGTVLADKSVPARRAPSPANRHGHLCAAPPGMVAREAAPGTARADRSAASVAVGGLVACYQNPWQEGGNELSPPLSQPPRSQQSLWMAQLCILRLHKILAMMMSFLKQHMFFMQEDHFPCHF